MALRRDVRAGLVGVKAARRICKVALHQAPLAVDDGATARLRGGAAFKT